MLISQMMALALAAGSPPAPAQAADGAKDEKICKKEQVTGSLARTKKTCMTRSQWNKLRDRGEEEYDKMNSNINPTNG